VVGEAVLSEYVRTVDVPAVVEPLALAERPVASPGAGIVRAVLVAPGQVVTAGSVLVEVVRDALPQPTLTFTESILKPLNEEYHQTSVNVRTTALALALARAERERLEAGSPAGGGVTGRVTREAEYAERRAELDLSNARREAERHGMTPEQVALLERGDAATGVPETPDVRRVLARNQLWSPEADALLGLLPERVRGVPHSIAVLGELVAAGRLSPQLVESVRASPALSERFLEVAGLVQQGLTPTALADLAARGGLDPLIEVHAPEGPPDWDVLRVLVRPGARVESGGTVVLLRDDRVMALHLSPAPSDLAALAGALTAGTDLVAEPLVRGAGENVQGVRLVALTGSTPEEEGGALAHAGNRALHEHEVPGLGRSRTWLLRPGLKLAVRVPVERWPGCFVLPADAIAYRAAEAVVLLEDGETFKPVPVRLEHHDARVAIVPPKGGIIPGDRIVLHGAPALGMALLAGQGGADPHAGHNH
jgi:multidrug efflux pump subunit AcrA (membrane-fusion protein)